MFLPPTISNPLSVLIERLAESYCAQVGGKGFGIRTHKGMDRSFNPAKEVNEQRG